MKVPKFNYGNSYIILYNIVNSLKIIELHLKWAHFMIYNLSKAKRYKIVYH